MPEKPRTILVVEDNVDHAYLVQLAANRADADVAVHVAEDGVEAVSYLSGKPPFDDRTSFPIPDLVILDLIMPRLDGFGVLSWLREHEEFATLPVVVLTSSVNPLDERRALSLGALAFLTKPADVAELGKQVKDIMERWLG